MDGMVKRVIMEETLKDNKYLNIYSIYLMFCPAKYCYYVFLISKFKRKIIIDKKYVFN